MKPPRRSRQPPCRRVLIVEPNRALRDTLEALLRSRGYHVDHARDAKTALESLMREELPDVILLELELPGMSGWNFLATQKGTRRISSIPTLVFSRDGKYADLTPRLHPDVDARLTELLESLDRLCASRSGPTAPNEERGPLLGLPRQLELRPFLPQRPRRRSA